MEITTHLISGAGNTFHVIRKIEIPGATESKLKELSKRICQNQFADGCIFLDGNAGSLSWSFFNNDGSEAEMCGNATRCVGFYVKNILQSPLQQWNLSTKAGDIKINFMSKEKYIITMTPIIKLSSERGFFCDTGVPHLVIELKKIDINEELKEAARLLRNHEEFLPKGTNVTYVCLGQDSTQVKAVSYERGVENFTQACGTGAAAAAFYNLTKRAAPQTEVEMPGGTLIMDLTDLKNPTMTGPAIFLGSYRHVIK